MSQQPSPDKNGERWWFDIINSTLFSDGFKHDTALHLTGDFEDDDEKDAYGKDLCARLNAIPSSIATCPCGDILAIQEKKCDRADCPVVAKSPSASGRTLFQSGTVRLHSGGTSSFKIDCDALTDDDVNTLARLIAARVGAFGSVEGVPRGGLRLAEAMRRFHSEGPLLIVDDVLTTGKSMEAQRAGRDAIGAVIFARDKCPSWVTPLWNLSPDISNIGEKP